MRVVLPLLLALVVCGSSALAQGDLLQEDFEDGVADGFVAECPLWEVTGGGTYHVDNMGYELYCWSFAGDTAWDNYTYSLDIKSMFSVNQLAAFRVQENGDCYVINVRSDPWNDAVISKWTGGSNLVLFSAPFDNVNEVWHHFEIAVLGPTMELFVDGQEVLTFTDTFNPLLNGKIGVLSYTGGVMQEQKLDIDNIMVDSFVVPVTNSSLSSVKALYR
jgi:hypothetical protein